MLADTKELAPKSHNIIIYMLINEYFSTLLGSKAAKSISLRLPKLLNSYTTIKNNENKNKLVD